MIGRSRPFRFVALVAGGWVTARVMLLWPVTGSLPAAVREALPLPFAIAAQPGTQAKRSALAEPIPDISTGSAVSALSPDRPGVVSTVPGAVPDPVNLALADLVGYDADPQRLSRRDSTASAPPAILALPRARTTSAGSRLSASAWLVARGDSGSGPRLGGSQAGIRVRYRIDTSDRLALAARLATPLAGVGREAAVGIEWRPIAAPVAIVAEHRIGFDGASGGPALMAIGGVDRIRVAAGFDLSGYAQAGVVARDRIDPFVDAALRLARPVAEMRGIRVEIGAGAWAAAQRGAGRVYMGPGVAAVVPVADRSLRIGLDWRQRVAGRAAPGSGVTLSLGTDF